MYELFAHTFLAISVSMIVIRILLEKNKNKTSMAIVKRDCMFLSLLVSQVEVSVLRRLTRSSIVSLRKLYLFWESLCAPARIHVQ